MLTRAPQKPIPPAQRRRQDIAILVRIREHEANLAALRSEAAWVELKLIAKKRTARRRRKEPGPATIANPQALSQTAVQSAIMYLRLSRLGPGHVIARCQARAKYRTILKAGLRIRPPVNVRPVPR